MAKRITWSRIAVADRIQILDYWFQRTGNKNYSRKLDLAFRHIARLLSTHPMLGRKIEKREERYFVKDSYVIFYRSQGNSIEILHIWDSRRNPDELII